MKLIRARTARLLWALIFAVTAACGSKARRPEHRSEATAAQPAPPTPDTTPIEALRTPAGLVLKVEPAMPPPETPAPSETPKPTHAPGG